MLEETPAKVLSLLGAALASLAFLFMVSVTDASFEGTLARVPDPLAPEKVVAFVDRTAASYSNFVAANFANPLQFDLALAIDNISWIGSNAKEGAIAMLGLPQQAPSYATITQTKPVGQVAGVRTERKVSSSHSGGILDTLYSALMK